MTEFFLFHYLNGEMYDEEHYEKIRDDELHLWLYHHRQSGIAVWCDALDFRAAELETSADALVLFHYTCREGMSCIADKRNAPIDMLSRLIHGDNPFGHGLITAAQEPHLFGHKHHVLTNFVWPRIGDVFKLGVAQVKSLKNSGNPGAGPSDPANQWVCTEILGDPKHQGAVDFCIPLLVPPSYVYPLGIRLTPDLEGVVNIGCNRWGEKQWQGRDICMVQFDEDGLDRLSMAGWSGNTSILEHRFHCIEGRYGPDHTNTVNELSSLTELLQASGKYEEAEPLLRRLSECEERECNEMCCREGSANDLNEYAMVDVVVLESDITP